MRAFARSCAAPPLVVSLLAALAGCSSETPPNPVKEAFAQAALMRDAGASVAFRFPTDGREPARLYRLPTLDSASFDAASGAIDRIVGFAGDEDLVYVLTSAAQLVALDVATGRTRVVDTSVVLAAIGPTGTPHLVRRDGSIAQVVRRALVQWSDRIEPLPTAIWAGTRNRLVAVTAPDSGSRQLVGLADGRPTVQHSLPDGEISVSLWGDVAVVATDSGLVVFDPADSAAPEFQKLRPRPGPVALSPAAHQIYTVNDAGELVAYDRFELRRVRRLRLPAPASALRTDPLGRTLLVRPASGDSVWIVDVVRWELAATVAGTWSDDLPAVAPDGTILVGGAEDVAALSGESLAVVDRVDGGAGDRWLTASWDPRRPTLDVARDSVAAPAPRGGAFYVQVSSTRNVAWAEDFAQNLQRAGMGASVLPPRDPDDLYRVVLGPYPTREAAEAVSRQLGLPSWITTRDTTSGVP